MKKILTEVLKEIKPTDKERKETFSKIDRVIKQIQKNIPNAKVILGGSGKKGTWLKTAHDADIFVQFSKGKDISNILERKLKKSFKIKRLHGSRDYFQITQDDFTFEIVPIIEINKADQAENITDVSPLHAKWVLKHKKYQDEIRLTKQFFKAAKVYGAESYINGFSGYICEILTIYYKGFQNLVKNITKWKSKVMIDVENYHKGKKILFELDKAKTIGPLVIIDPVQKSRNAAAAVSEEKFEKIINYSKKFLTKSSKRYFEIQDIDIKKLKVGKNELFLFEAKTMSGKDDVVGCKLLKGFEHIKKELVKNEFKILSSDWEWNKLAKFYFVVKKEVLPDKKIVKGPPIRIKEGVVRFKKKHKDVFEKNKVLFAREKRDYRKADQLMKAMLKDKYIKEKVKQLTLK